MPAVASACSRLRQLDSLAEVDLHIPPERLVRRVAASGTEELIAALSLKQTRHRLVAPPGNVSEPVASTSAPQSASREPAGTA